MLSKIFELGSRTSDDANDVVPLTRSVAEEIVLAGVFGLIAATDVSVPYDCRLFATDASTAKGAFTALEISPELSSSLWLGGDRKGAYTMLESPARRALRTIGVDRDAEPLPEDFPGPCKTLDFAFDVVEVCGGSGVLSKALAQRGLRVCPPIDISSSPHYDITNPKLLNWIFQMIAEGRFKGVVCEPVCTTFSPAQHPASRSYAQPLGFNRKDPKTKLGNTIAFRCLAILWFAWRNEVLALLEQPQLSKMAWLSFWQFLLQIGFGEAIINSCAFGSPHKKPFRWLGYGIDMKALNVPCPGSHHHVRIQGKFTKASSIYHPGLAKFLAEKIHEALLQRGALEQRKEVCIESVVINDLLQRPGWEVLGAWHWKQTGHINVLESRSYVALLKHLVLEGGDARINTALDSRVAKGAHAKGRSSALSLRPSLCRAAALQVAGNLHPSLVFAPTRLNTADSPTRDKPLPSPARESILDFLSQTQIAHLHSRQFSRAASGWIRLCILLATCPCPGLACSLNTSGTLDFVPQWTFSHLWILHIFHGLCAFVLLHQFWIFWGEPLNWGYCNLIGAYLIHMGFFGRHFCAAAMPLSPAGTEEIRRAQRRAGVQLQADRVILQQTRDRRGKLLAAFDSWLGENFRIDLESLLNTSPLDIDAISDALVAYGRDMFRSGKSYGRYSETINALTSRKPILRKQVMAAWDLAFNWVVDEPHQHNTALPLAGLIAAVALSLLWGWSREAAIFAAAWAGVLRIGEILAAKRRDLILPADSVPGTWFALIKIRQPKTRGRAARHQSAKIEPEDVVRLLTSTFGRLSPDEPLWPFAPATLRKRFGQILKALGLVSANGTPQFTLASLRPGGATHWLQITEDAEYVRRKGRWLSTRVLEIYLQETPFATFYDHISKEAKSRIEALCKEFPVILQKAIFFRENLIPEQTWHRLW